MQVFSSEILLVCCLKYPHSCFSSHFCFLVILVMLILALSVLLLVANLLSRFLCSLRVVYCHINMQASPLPPFLDTYSLSLSSLGCKTLCIISSFLVLWSIYLSSFLVHFKNVTRVTAKVFIPFMRFLLYSLVSISFLVLLKYSFFFLSFLLVWWCPLPMFPLFVSFVFSGHSDFSWFGSYIPSVMCRFPFFHY